MIIRLKIYFFQKIFLKSLYFTEGPALLSIVERSGTRLYTPPSQQSSKLNFNQVLSLFPRFEFLLE